MRSLCCRDRRPKALPAFGQVAVDLPEPTNADHEAQRELGLPRFEGVREGCAQVVVLVLDAGQPTRLFRPGEPGVRLVCEGYEMLEVIPAKLVALIGALQPLDGV